MLILDVPNFTSGFDILQFFSYLRGAGILEGSLNLDGGGMVFLFLIIVTVGSCMMMIDEYLKDARSDHPLFLSATH